MFFLILCAVTIASCSDEFFSFPEVPLMVISVDVENAEVEAYNNGVLETVPIYPTVNPDSLNEVLSIYKESLPDNEKFEGMPVIGGIPDQGPNKGKLFVMSY